MTAVIKKDSLCSAKFTLEFAPKPKHNKCTDIAKIMMESLSPEMKDGLKRSEIKIINEKNKVVLDIAAKDTAALRAAINSNLRLLCCAADVCERVIKN